MAYRLIGVKENSGSKGMTVSTVDEFRRLLAASHLLSESQLQQLPDEAAGPHATAQTLAERLVESNHITAWQAGMLLAGRTRFFLGRYRLLEKLGEGGMGAVFKAEQQPLGRVVALKVMSQKYVADEAAAARFQREMQAAAALDHPNIVHAYDADSVGGTSFLVMEYVQGVDLANLAKQRRLMPVGAACWYVLQAARGLQHAHERGMVHRDIKPANLLVQISEPSEETSESVAAIKILDFGLAKLSADQDATRHLTKTGQMMGTPDYIAPEQARSTRDADIRCDLYSLGCVLFNLIGGRVPFPEGGMMDRLMAKATLDAPHLKQIRPDIPDAVDAIVAKMIARDPGDRFQTPGEVIEALSPFADDAPTPPTAITGEARSPETQISQTHVLTDRDSDFGLFLKALTDEAEILPKQDAAAVAPTRVAIEEPIQNVPVLDTGADRTATAGGVSERLESARAAERKRRRWWIAGGLTVIGLLAASLVWVSTGKTTIVVDLPNAERTDATLSVDGLEVDISDGEPIEIIGDPGPKTLRLTRPGFETIEKSWNLSRSESITWRPKWRLSRPRRRERQWTQLNENATRIVADFRKSKPPDDDPFLIALRKKLQSFRRQWPKTQEAGEASQLLANLPAPIDALPVQDFNKQPVTGGVFGLPPKTPPQLVHAFGDFTLRQGGYITGLAFSKDGKRLLVGDKTETAQIAVWDWKAGRVVAARRASTEIGGVHRIAVDNKRQQVLVATYGGLRTMNFQLASGRVTLSHDRKELPYTLLNAPAFSPDGTRFAVASYIEDAVRLHDATSGKLIRLFKGDSLNIPCDVAFHPNGKLIATADSTFHKDNVFVWELATGKLVKTLSFNRAKSLTFSPNGTHLLVGGAGIGERKFIRTWLVESWKPAQSYSDRAAARLTFTPDGKSLVFTLNNGIAFVPWNRDGETRTVAMIQATAIAFTPDSRIMAVGDSAGHLHFFDVATLKRLTPVRPAIRSCDVSADGRLIAFGLSTGDVALRDLTNGNVVRTLRPNPKENTQFGPSNVRFTPDSRTLVAVYSNSDVMQAWEVQSGAWKWGNHYFNGHPESVAFSRDSKSLALGVPNSARARILNVADGKVTKTIGGNGTGCVKLAWNIAGDRLAIQYASETGRKTKIWNIKDGAATNSFGPAEWFDIDVERGNLLLYWKSSGELQSIDLDTGRSHAVSRGEIHFARYAGAASRIVVADTAGIRVAGLNGNLIEKVTGNKTFGHGRLATPDGRRLLIRVDNRLDIYPLKKSVRPDYRRIDLPGSPFRARLTPDGRHLIAICTNGIAYVVRLAQLR